jgi:hypothetical protein
MYRDEVGIDIARYNNGIGDCMGAVRSNYNGVNDVSVRYRTNEERRMFHPLARLDNDL